MVSMVLSQRDYCNGIVAGITKKELMKMQNIQANKLVLRKSKFSSSTEALKDLHWLSICTRINFKISCLMFKCVQKTALDYLTDTVKINTRRTVWNRTEIQFKVPFVSKKKSHANCAFSVNGSRTRNELPDNIRKWIIIVICSFIPTCTDTSCFLCCMLTTEYSTCGAASVVKLLAKLLPSLNCACAC